MSGDLRAFVQNENQGILIKAIVLFGKALINYINV